MATVQKLDRLIEWYSQELGYSRLLESVSGIIDRYLRFTNDTIYSNAMVVSYLFILCIPLLAGKMQVRRHLNHWAVPFGIAVALFSKAEITDTRQILQAMMLLTMAFQGLVFATQGLMLAVMCICWIVRVLLFIVNVPWIVTRWCVSWRVLRAR